MAYNPQSIAALRRYAQQSGAPVAYVASALVESNLDPNAIGDNGDSVGLFQENINGRGHGLSVAQRSDPNENARRAAEEFSRTAGAGPERAFNAQRPADHDGYIAAIKSRMDEARGILRGSQAGRVGTSGVGKVSPAPSSPGLNLDQMALDALSNRQPGQSLTRQIGNQYIASQLAGAPDQVVDKKPAAQAALGTVGTRALPTSKADQAIKAGQEVLGTPYSWGGGGPGGKSRGFAQGANTIGFDCSSLMQYVTSKVGVSIPRTTYGQIKAGAAVNATNRGAWKPGDLLFPSVGHVQMYVGNGQVLEAPQTGGHVQIVPARSAYQTVRRVM